MTSISQLAAAVLNAQVLVFFGALGLLSFASRRRLAKPLKTSSVKAFAALLSLSAVISVTLLGRHFEGLAPSFWLTDVSLWHGVFTAQRPNFILNLLLFVPAGLTVSLAWRRSIATLLALTLLSFAIECIQQGTGFGAPDPADWVANSLGAAVGVMFSLIAIKRPKN